MADSAPDRFERDEHWQIEDTLLKDARSLDLRVIETKIVTTIDRFDEARVDVRITLEDNPDVLAKRALGLIFAIGALSFADADANPDVMDHDEWTSDDMLRRLSFERGRLRFEADDVRGRCMNTRVEIDGSGRISLETSNRCEAARQWIATLQDLQVISGGGGCDDDASLDPLPSEVHGAGSMVAVPIVGFGGDRWHRGRQR